MYVLLVMIYFKLPLLVLSFNPLLSLSPSSSLINCKLTSSCKYIKLEKPFVKVYDKEEEFRETYEIDQLNSSCPLELGTSSKETGCLCNFKSLTIDCLYPERINQQKFPKFIKLSHKSNESSSSIIWNVDLRCKNVSYINDFQPFFAFEKLNRLDLSGNSTHICKYLNDNNDLTKPFFSDLTKIVIGSQHYSSSKHNQHHHHHNRQKTTTTATTTTSKHSLANDNSLPSNRFLEINNLNLSSNRINEIYLNNNLNDKLSIKSIDLSNNRIESINLDNFNENLDICGLNISIVNLSSNLLSELDVSLLIYPSELYLKNNTISKFQISFFDKLKQFGDFKPYESNLEYRKSTYKCYMKNFQGSNEPSTHNKNTTFISNLTVLDLSFNKLNYLPFLYLKDRIIFKSIESLKVDHNGLKVLNLNQFTNMSELKSLSINHNRITHLDDTTFADLIKLKYLDLSHNQLTAEDLNRDLFKHQNNSLETLVLDENQFTRVPKQAFEYLISVKYLYLNDNKIKKVDNYSFGFMSQLIELYLSNNKIEYIDLNAFQIDDRSMIGPGLTEKLDLSYNSLTYLNSSVFSYLTNLRYLLLNNNRIKSIDKSTFKGINYLISLDLNLNKISDLSFLVNNVSLAQLRYLKLSNNEISELKANDLMYLNALNTFDLSSNKIEHIADCAFHGIQLSIRKLYLNFNQITRLNSCAFMSNFRYLRFVQILYNPLDCSTNCEFFFTVYSKPYSVNYEGIECISNVNDFKKSNKMKYCTNKQYEKISQKCQKKLIDNKCFRIVINATSTAETTDPTTRVDPSDPQVDSQSDGSLNHISYNNSHYDYDQEFSFDYNNTFNKNSFNSLLKSSVSLINNKSNPNYSNHSKIYLLFTFLIIFNILFLN